MNTYINEPIVQKLPAFYNFMGGWNYVAMVQGLNVLTSAPRHWRGTKIDVVNRGHIHREDVPLTVYQDDILVHCNHAHQELEYTTFEDGTDREHGHVLAICQKCGAGWSKDGEQLVEGI